MSEPYDPNPAGWPPAEPPYDGPPPTQPYQAQPYPDSYPAQQFTGQQFTGPQFPGQQYPAQPYPSQPYPAQQYPTPAYAPFGYPPRLRRARVLALPRPQRRGPWPAGPGDRDGGAGLRRGGLADPDGAGPVLRKLGGLELVEQRRRRRQRLGRAVRAGRARRHRGRAGLLIAGGVVFSNGKRLGRTLTALGLAVCVVEALFWIIRLEDGSGAIVPWAVFYLIMPIVGTSLSFAGQVSRWLDVVSPKPPATTR